MPEKTKKPTVNEKVKSDAPSKIELVKNLIFGENIEAYNSEFAKINEDIISKKRELEDFIEVTKKELNQVIDNLSTDLNIRITDLENNLQNRSDELMNNKVDKKMLGSLLIKLGEKISKE